MMIPYLGDKSKLSHFILPFIPENFSIYVEPFGGMFGIYFCLDLVKYQHTIFVYNDINPLNSNLINHLKSEEFLNKLDKIEIDYEFYQKSKNELNSSTDIDRAIHWLVILTCSASQLNLMDGNWKGGSELESVKRKLANSHHLKKNILVYNLDYRKIIQKFDCDSAFFFIDPPYFGKESYYINHDFTSESHHLELLEFVKGMRGKFMISYLYFDKLNDWYKDYRIVTHETKRGVECVIMNY